MTTRRHFGGDETTEADDGKKRLQFLPNPGDVVDNRYEVLHELGEGGFGWVYKVQHKLLGQHFAMKILQPQISSEPQWRQRFREEARATSLIGHENIVFVTDFGECSKHGYYFIMEYLDGASLAKHLNGPMNLQLTMRFAIAAASALGAVHELGIVHCDLKPENVILLERPGRNEIWKFLDFGTSNVVTRAADSEFVYGTPAYMAPEQAVGADVDSRSDQFSLACVIYEMLTGIQPWAVQVWEDALPAARRERVPRSILEFRKDVPKAFDDAIFRALSVRRASRYETVEAFVRALRETIEVEFEPAQDPQDLKVASRGFERSFTAPRIEQSLDPGASMVISLETGLVAHKREAPTPEVNIVFQSVDRLAREYRRNMLAGGMFVSSPMVLPIEAPVRINLTLAPRKMSIHLDARVVSRTVIGDPAEVGFGVLFSPESQKDLERWLKNPMVGLELRATDVLSRVRELDPTDTISAAEAFIVSMLNAPTTVQRLRSICAGLPVDFNETVAGLLQKQYVHIEAVEATEAQDVFARGPAPAVFSSSDIGRIVEQCEFFERQHNFWGAISTLRKTLEVLPDQPELLYRLAKLEHQFRDNRSDALRFARRALILRPQNTLYRELVEELETPSSSAS